MDYLMILLIIFLITTICFNMRINKTNEFMSKKQTDILKGICSVIIIFVHIPNNYSNRIQDIISSFGYICVSIFFMLSAYGLKYSLTNKTDYLNKFLLKRLPSVIIPFLIANIINIIVNKSYNPESFKILGFVYVLLIYYVVFYLIYKFCKNRETADSLMITFVILFSVIGKLTNSLIGWQTEQIGFILGILIFNYYQYLKAFFKNKAILIFWRLFIKNNINDFYCFINIANNKKYYI